MHYMSHSTPHSPLLQKQKQQKLAHTLNPLLPSFLSLCLPVSPPPLPNPHNHQSAREDISGEETRKVDADGHFKNKLAASLLLMLVMCSMHDHVNLSYHVYDKRAHTYF